MYLECYYNSIVHHFENLHPLTGLNSLYGKHTYRLTSLYSRTLYGVNNHGVGVNWGKISMVSLSFT